MLKLAILFFVISLIAGALGFTGIAAGAAVRMIKVFLQGLGIAVLAVALSGCEPKPPKPKTDFSQARSS